MADTLKAPPNRSAMRQEFVDAVLKDLLGPAGSPDEELDEGIVRDRYLIGMLAPRRHQIIQEEFDELAEGGADSVEEGATEPSTPQAKAMFPSSFGLSFSVAADAEAIRITARWGQYVRKRSETLTTERGDKKLVWKRVPRGGISEPIRLEPGAVPRWVPDAECPDVSVQGIIRRRERHWSVTLFLVNGQDEPKQSKDSAWLFQPELIVESSDGKPIFQRHHGERDPSRYDAASYAEEQALEMLYRHRIEFAVGHGVSVHAEIRDGGNRAIRISTRTAPMHEVARVMPPTSRDFPLLADLVLDMKKLAETTDSDLPRRLAALPRAYAEWIADQEARAQTGELAAHRDAGDAALRACRASLQRIEAGIRLLGEDAQAAEAFRFANRAMWLQRVRSTYTEQLRRGGGAVELADVDVPVNRSWYPFQLAFILLNLPGLTRLDHPDRTGEANAVADLLWFSTGGGKTEAYLGLSAYVMAIRRLQGTIAGRAGEPGLAVLMRYTLRLLTLQQFQRAAALMCACEVIRREALSKADKRWGEAPFRIGLWVGRRATPNTTDQSAEAVKQDHGQGGAYGSGGGSGSPHQLTNCPWCGARIEKGKDIRVETYKRGRGRTWIYCGDRLGRCPFTPKEAPDEGLPVVVVDEEVYRRLPAMIIATVDKFAQMPWNGSVQTLFGRVDGLCERHGFRTPELEDAGSHPRSKFTNLPPAKTIPHPPLRPPDLIIQDELHLISGPLGTLVGLYETVVDALCEWEVDGKIVRPKVIASTATIRRAGDQVNAVFLRRVNVFPPQGLDIRDNFFSLEHAPSEEEPGRLYLGICAPGRRLKAALIRVYTAALSAAQQLYDRYGAAADPWMTLVGYFNSMRELGGMRRLIDDDVRTRLTKMDERGLAKRALSFDAIDELTSRKGSTDIPEVLDRLAVAFDPAAESLRKQMAKQGQFKNLPAKPLDILLATNMVSVGVDVPRLGLMVVGGQPKATAEYIQATSRVGRRYPGVVCTVYNWARPRDLSHYETFEHYHATFYKHVEALSVTPFAPGALSRGLTALLVSLIRLTGIEFNENHGASRIDRHHPYVRQALDLIERRAHLVGNGAEVARAVRAELEQRLDQWLAEAQRAAGGRVLGYRDAKDGITVPLLRQPGIDPWDDFTCLNSLRDVEPMIGLVLADTGLDVEEAPVTPADTEVEAPT